MAVGFRFAYRLSGGAPTIKKLISDDTSLHKGDLLNLESGHVDLLATADTAGVGVCLETNTGLDGSTERVACIIDADAVYEVDDANARLVGATLDVSGATGAQTVAASSNKNFVVVEESSATEPTRVRFNTGKHFLNVAL